MKKKIVLLLLSLISSSSVVNAWPWMSPYAYCNGNPVRFVDPDGKKSLLIIWASSPTNFGHAAFAVQNYNGTKPTDTYTVYGLFPGVKYNGEHAKDNKTVPSKYAIDTNATLSDIREGKFTSGEEGAKPDGILQINSDYTHDKNARKALTAEKNSKKGYNGRSRNCSTFAREGVRAATGDQNIDGEESVGNIFTGFDEVATPNQLYYDTSKNSNVGVVVEAGDKINYKFNDTVNAATKEVIKGH